MSAMNKLAVIKKILAALTDIICDNLDPKLVLRTMKSKGALTPDDVKRIESKPVESDQAEKLLDILMSKPASAYDIFISTLRAKGREDLYNHIRDIEMEHGYGREGRF